MRSTAWRCEFSTRAVKLAHRFAHFFFLCEAVVFRWYIATILRPAVDFEMANNYATVFFCLFMMFDGHYINNKSIRSRQGTTSTTSRSSRSQVDRGRELLQLGHLCRE